MRKLLFFVVLAAITVACRQSRPVAQTAAAEPAWYENDSALAEDLAEAIAAVRPLDAANVRTLMPISKDTPGQQWTTIDGHDMVLVVTLVDSSRLKRFFGRDDLYRIEREMGTWVSLPGDWAQRRAAFEGLDSVAAHMRLLQMYGLSPDCDYDIMVRFYADPAYIFRPSPDPDITTTKPGLDFPDYADENYKVGETNFREWYRYSLEAAFEDDSPLPWTQLGYTYDWHHGADRQGVSEYIVTHHALVKVHSSESAWDFVRNLPK